MDDFRHFAEKALAQGDFVLASNTASLIAQYPYGGDKNKWYCLEESAFSDPILAYSDLHKPDSLPPAFRPNFNLKFSTFEGRQISAKYVVRDYYNQIKRLSLEAANFHTKLTSQIDERSAMQNALTILNFYRNANAFDVRLRKERARRGSEFWLQITEPECSKATVLRSRDVKDGDGSTYEEEIILIASREFHLGSKLGEVLHSSQPFAITYHALLRIWERTKLDGQSFHREVSRAFRKTIGVAAFVELAQIRRNPSDLMGYVSVPFLDGMLILSRRSVISDASFIRGGFRWDKQNSMELDPVGSGIPVTDLVFEHSGRSLIKRPVWFIVTFLSEMEISNLDRVLACRELNKRLTEEHLSKFVVTLEWFLRGHLGFDDEFNGRLESLFGQTDFQAVVDLQRRMLAREDSADDRVYVLTD